MAKRGKPSRKKNINVSLMAAQTCDYLEGTSVIQSPLLRIMEARKILNGSQNPEKFKFRQKQIANIQKCINDLLSKQKPKKSRFLMLTGSPGTGKTLSANFVLRNSSYRVIFMNANSVKSKNDVQKILANELLPQQQIPQNLTTFKLLSLLEEKKIPPTIIYIEEIELFFKSTFQMLSEDFFDLFRHSKIRIMLLGISNTIDAIERHGDKMKVRVEDITNIVFKPYSSTDIISIIQQKLEETAKKTGIRLQFSGNLIKFVVNKLSQIKQSDMRYVFQFLKSLGKLILPETRKDFDDIVITIQQVNKALGEIKIEKNLLFQSIPVGQQMVIIAIYNHLRRYDQIFLTEENVRKSLKEVYQQLNLHLTHEKELNQELSELEDNGFIEMKGKKNCIKKDRIFLKVSLDDIKYFYEEHPRFSKLILY